MFCHLYSEIKFYFVVIGLLSFLGVNQLVLAQQNSVEVESEEWIADTMCALDNRTINLEQSPSFTFTRSDGNNPRHLDAAQAGLTTDDFPKIRTRLGARFSRYVRVTRCTCYCRLDSLLLCDRLWSSFFALDINSGCAKWVYTADSRLRSSIAYSEIDESHVFGF